MWGKLNTKRGAKKNESVKICAGIGKKDTKKKFQLLSFLMMLILTILRSARKTILLNTPLIFMLQKTTKTEGV